MISYNKINIFNMVVRKYTTSGAEILVKRLKKHKCNNIFLYSGGANLSLLDEIKKQNVNHIMNINEQCSGHSATGYSKSSSKIGVVISTSGPGLTNLITPLLDAKNDSIPLIALTGQVPIKALGTNAFQEAPAIELMQHCTKKSTQIRHIKDIEYLIDEAYHITSDGKPGPVHIDCPKDIMAQLIDIDLLNKISTKFTKPIYHKELELIKLEELIKLINISKKPVIIAGQGTNNCSTKLREFVIKSQIPITTTLHAMGVFDETHELSLHMLGMHGSAYANYTVQDADLIIAIGTRFDDRTTGNLKEYGLNAKQAGLDNKGGIVHINIDTDEFNKIINTNINIKGDCSDNLSWLIKNIKPIDRTIWINKIKKLKKLHPFNYSLEHSEQIKTQSVIDMFYNKTKDRENVIVTTGVGNHQMMAAQFYRWKYPKRIITSGSLGTMGVGVPFAIGTQLANPDSLVFCLDGDGSFNMTCNDLATISKLNLPIKILIMNDGRQQMVHVWQKLFFNSNYIATDNFNPDYCKLADAFGIDSYKIETKSELDNIFEHIIDTDKPVLIDFKVTPDICLPLVPPGNSLSSMILKLDEEKSMKGIVPS